MPIACTRCGKIQEGEILNAPITFTFKHEKGCGMGIGPLVVTKIQVKKPKIEEFTAKETIVEELKPQIIEAKKEKSKHFGNRHG